MHVGRTEARAEPPGAWEPVTGGGMAGAQAGRAAAVGERAQGRGALGSSGLGEAGHGGVITAQTAKP